MALILLSGPGVTIVDVSGDPVAGASVCTDSCLVGVSDRDGTVHVPGGIDSLQVRAVGYETWSGAMPASRFIELRSIPVPSGMVVTVTGTRGILRDYFPATTSLGREQMMFLGRNGLRGLMSLSGGVFVREYGGSMPVVSISVRGSDPAHSRFCVDGHDISSSMDGSPGMNIDPVVFGGMEISRGSGSRYQSGGMAGTLNFLPPSRTGPPEAFVSAGDDGSGQLYGSLPAVSGRLALSLRRNRGAAGTTGYSGTFLMSGMRNETSWGMLGSVSAGDTESPQWTLPTDGRRERGSLDGWGRVTLDGLTLSAGLRAGRHHFTSSVPSDIDDTHDEAGARAGAEIRGRAGELDVRLSAGLLLDRVVSTSLGHRNMTELKTSLHAGCSDGISANASVTLSYVPERGILPGAGFMLGFPLGDSVLITHAGASLGFRRPTLNDLYWPEDSFARGNPDLEPETSVEAEAGVSLNAVRWARIFITGFTGESRDLIRWEPGDGGKWTPVNVARVLRQGVEVEAWAESGPLRVSGALTLLDVRDNDPGSVDCGRTLPYVPDCTWALGAGIQLHRCCILNLGAGGTGIRFMNYSETSWMDPYTVIHGSVTISHLLPAGLSLDISADNLLDEEYMETSGFPGRGRTLHMGLRWRGV